MPTIGTRKPAAAKKKGVSFFFMFLTFIGERFEQL